MRLLTFSVLRNCKFKTFSCFPRQFSCVVDSAIPKLDIEKLIVRHPSEAPRPEPSFIDISLSWPPEHADIRAAVLRDMQVWPEFITEEEEHNLLQELEPVLRRMRYEFDHWDGAIHGFRETERRTWKPENEVVISRVKAAAFPDVGSPSRHGPNDPTQSPSDPTKPVDPTRPQQDPMRPKRPYDPTRHDDDPRREHNDPTRQIRPLPHTHVLDLAPAGYIKPHVDAVRFCGSVIAGVCLESSAVMRLVHARHEALVADALIPRRCLYIMRGTARYDFTHAVLGGADSVWRGEKVCRRRRVAVITRAQPRPEDRE